MSIMSHTVTFILAGGRDDRLYPILTGTPKPLLSFGGVFSILDFTISNCVNSDIGRAYVLTQYKSGAISRYIESSAWKTELIRLQPRFLNANRGTADLLYQNLDLIRDPDTRYVLVLNADNIYKMNYSRLVRFHENHGGEATIAAARYPRSSAVAGMGVYVFNAPALHKALLRDAGRFGTNHDFERDILPKLICSDRVYAYDSTASDSDLGGYCRNLTTIDSYHRSQMEVLAMNSAFDPYQDARWPMCAAGRPAASFVVANPHRLVQDSIISEHSEISGAAIIQSIISPSVTVAAGAHISGSVLMRGARVGRGAQIRRAIVCDGVVIPEGERIGFDPVEDRGRFFVTDNGVAVVHSNDARKLQNPKMPVRMAKSA
jgi:glucose-1-phosphate adenylyltransferase